MRRSILLLSLLALIPASASAQTIMVTVDSFSGRTMNFDLAAIGSVDMGPITRAECDAAAEITFRFNMVDINRQNLDFFWGDMCDDATVRNDNTNESCQDIDHPSEAIMGNQMVTVSIPVTALVDCTDSGSGRRTIWVLALDNPMDAVGSAGQSTSFPIAFDFQGPGQPANVVASNGESSTRVTWDGTTDQVSSYEIFLVEGGCEGGAVTTDAFAGDTISIPPAVVTDNGNVTSQTVSFSDTLPIGGEAAVAVRGIDIAGNIGEISAVACVTRIEVDTWWDTYCRGPDASEACTSSGCRAAPGRRSGGLALLLLGAAALFVARRRA